MNNCIFCQTCTIFGTNHCHEQCPDYDPINRFDDIKLSKMVAAVLGIPDESTIKKLKSTHYVPALLEVKIND